MHAYADWELILLQEWSVWTLSRIFWGLDTLMKTQFDQSRISMPLYRFDAVMEAGKQAEAFIIGGAEKLESSSKTVPDIETRKSD